MGVGQARNRVRNAVERTVPFGMLIQSLVVVWYALQGRHPDDALARRLAQPWYQTKTEPSFEDTITKLRKTLIVARFTPASPGQPNPVLLHDYAWPVPQPPRSCETRVSAGCGSFLPRLVEDSERDPGGRARPRGGEGQAAAAVPARQPLVKDQQPTCAARLGGDERHGDIDRLVTLAVGPLIADRAGVARS